MDSKLTDFQATAEELVMLWATPACLRGLAPAWVQDVWGFALSHAKLLGYQGGANEAFDWFVDKTRAILFQIEEFPSAQLARSAVHEFVGAACDDDHENLHDWHSLSAYHAFVKTAKRFKRRTINPVEGAIRDAQYTLLEPIADKMIDAIDDEADHRS